VAVCCLNRRRHARCLPWPPRSFLPSFSPESCTPHTVRRMNSGPSSPLLGSRKPSSMPAVKRDNWRTTMQDKPTVNERRISIANYCLLGVIVVAFIWAIWPKSPNHRKDSLPAISKPEKVHNDAMTPPAPTYHKRCSIGRWEIRCPEGENMELRKMGTAIEPTPKELSAPQPLCNFRHNCYCNCHGQRVGPDGKVDTNNKDCVGPSLNLNCKPGEQSFSRRSRMLWFNPDQRRDISDP
jgi:hypothetical protein